MWTSATNAHGSTRFWVTSKPTGTFTLAYGIIVQELVDLMQDNKDKVSEIMKLFLAED